MSHENELQLISDWLNLDSPELVWDRVARLSPYWMNNNLIVPDMQKERHTAHCDCDYDHEAEVIYPPDGGPVILCPYTGCVRSVTARELKIWHFNGAAFAGLLAKLLECKGRPTELLGGRLWNLGMSRHRLGGITRNLFFSSRMSSDTDAVYNLLPQDGIQAVLISGSSHVCRSEHFKDDLVFTMSDILSFSGDAVSVELEAMESRLGGIPKEEKPKATAGDHGKYMAKMHRELYEYLKSAYYFYTQGEGLNGGEFPHMTLRYMAERLGCVPTTVRDILKKVDETKRKEYKEIGTRWQSCQTREGVLHFGNSYFPSVKGFD